jgi:hypothetical protein
VAGHNAITTAAMSRARVTINDSLTAKDNLLSSRSRMLLVTFLQQPFGAHRVREGMEETG